ncbi:UNVERIFIED_CONTAM: hypothetical protein K2H54_055337 [Gekko kuhli]
MAAAGEGGTACGGEQETAALGTPASGTFVAGTPCAFSPSERRFLALSGPDGRLRVWETPSSRLQHEYVPSAHLSAACTCLAWAPPGAGGGRTAPSKALFWAVGAHVCHTGPAPCKSNRGRRGEKTPRY